MATISLGGGSEVKQGQVTRCSMYFQRWSIPPITQAPREESAPGCHKWGNVHNTSGPCRSAHNPTQVRRPPEEEQMDLYMWEICGSNMCGYFAWVIKCGYTIACIQPVASGRLFIFRRAEGKFVIPSF